MTHITHELNISIYALLAAFVMPLGPSFVAKTLGNFHSDNNRNPRDFLAATKGMAARAHAAHQNSFEILPVFIGSVLCSILFGVSVEIINTLASVFIGLRIAFALAYIYDKHIIRSVLWVLSAACPIALFVLSTK